jgi:signal transduction histidine kinase
MRLPLSLRVKLACIFLAMLFMVLICGVGMVWNTRLVNTMLTEVMQKDLILYEKAREMELALANQKGYLTYFFVDGNTKWINSLTTYQKVFRQHLDTALAQDLNDEQQTSLIQIEQTYKQYQTAKDEAIQQYRVDSNPEIISVSHEKQRRLFFSLLESCESFSRYQWQIILAAKKHAVERSKHFVRIALWAIAVFIGLCALFLFVLYRQILGPIRDLIIKTGGSPKDKPEDEVVSLSHSLNGMIKDIDETHQELTKSRKNLLHAERKAVVGELAAGVAHTIRNPLTSIKMRVFSLSRSLSPNKEQNEDLQVISDEIERIDKIVRNFIEFARPPKLQFEKHSLEELVRSVSILMKYRLSRYKSEIVYDFKPGVSKILVDGDRIKEALLNLVTNSCEAMMPGGKIHISESREHDPDIGEAAVLTIKDDGHGIPESIVDKTTIPFFTTKEEGSGLGLSTVARIVQEHGGKLVIPPVDDGCVIIIKLPV